MKIRIGLVLALSLFCASLTAQDKPADMDKFITKLMKKMTVEEKIGQMNLPVSNSFVAGAVADGSGQKSLTDRIKAGEVGGLFGLKGAASIKSLQKEAVENSRLGIPLIFGLDVIHGYDVTFPIPLALASSWNMALIEQEARLSAIEASSDGVCWVFSPMVDICRDPRWGRIAEGAGEDPYLGGEVSRAIVKGYQTDNDLTRPDNVMACVKHYALYGGAEAGRDYNTVDMSRQRIFNEYMRPYMTACEQGAGSYMASFNEFEGIPATANKYLLDEVLRKQWGFDGFIVTDYNGISEMVNHGLGDGHTVAVRALEAGIDMDMVCEHFSKYLKEALDRGEISQAQIDAACRRVLEAKYKLGLFSDPYRYCDEERSKASLSAPAHIDAARSIARECQVLLKNEGGVLPLKKEGKIAVIGPLGDSADDMLGSWSGSSVITKPVSILQGLRNVVGDKAEVNYAQGSYLVEDPQLEKTLTQGFMGFVIPGAEAKPFRPRTAEELLSEALELAKASDVIVATLGENANMNGEGASRSNPCIPEPQQELLKALVATGKPVVLVITCGRPLILSWEDENVPAILNSWSLGVEAGNAVADVLFGDANPSAKITNTFPRSVGQIPLAYNHKNTGRPYPDNTPYARFSSNYMDVDNSPLYPFGYGLSYTTYEYGDVVLSSSTMQMDGEVTVSVKVTNTGTRDGKETVQLYIHDVYSTSTRPVKELRQFKQIDLKAGESSIVSFRLTAEDLKYYNHELQYVCEPGDFEIMAGPNSRDTRKAVLTVK